MKFTVVPGALVVQRDQVGPWLFGVPVNIKSTLEEIGSEIPDVVFTTGTAPGLGRLGKPVMRFKEQAFNLEHMKASVIRTDTGTDYGIETEYGKILYTERPKLSAEDVFNFDLVVATKADNPSDVPFILADKYIEGTIEDKVVQFDEVVLPEEKIPSQMALLLDVLKDAGVEDLPDEMPKHWAHAYKAEDDTWRWASVSSVADWDNQNELFPPEAMDWAIKLNELMGDSLFPVGHGPLRYRHVPGLDGGHCDTQLRVGDYLFEAGKFNDTPIGQSMRQKLKEDPEGWSISVGLWYRPQDLVNGVYQKAVIFERSMTQSPAQPRAIISNGFKENAEMSKVLDAEQLKSIADELGVGVDVVQGLYDRATAVATKELEMEEVLKASDATLGGAATGANNPDHIVPAKTEASEAMSEGPLAGIRIKAESLPLYESLLDLDEDEWDEFANVALVAKKSRDDEFEEDTAPDLTEDVLKEKKGKKKMDYEDEEDDEGEEDDEEMEEAEKEDDLIDDLEELVVESESINQILAIIKEQNAAITTVASSVSAIKAELAGMQQQTVKELATLPRNQFEQVVKDANVDDDTIVAKLAQVLKAEGKQEQQSTAPPMYNLFTSQRLNQK